MTGTAPKPLHRWDLSPREAAELQRELVERLSQRWQGPAVKVVAGVDVHYQGGMARAAIALLSFPGLDPLAKSIGRVEVPFPYVPGLLSFREGPAILAAWEGLRRPPDLVLFDGQGIAHPRGIGLAAHIGLWLDLPTIGVAKSRLFGTYQEPGTTRGSTSALWDEREPDRQIGTVLRSRTDVRPLFVSPGHRIDLDRAVEYTLACCSRYRLPEPIRWAHRLAGGGQWPQHQAQGAD